MEGGSVNSLIPPVGKIAQHDRFGSLVTVQYPYIALEELPMEQREILKAYDYQPKENLEMTMTEADPNVFSFTYESFDGEVVYGQISYPDDESEKYLVLIGISAMGRNDYIWPVEFTIVEQLHKTRKSACPEMAESAKNSPW
jgi:hypothetical protein